ncbi:hypothetical protein AGDE_13475 [Angomonas deanei]|uniref:Uncharacterized protein n=1 Tax=Angomonas deanei TaxID=59799 RepID=A0A7G2CKI2_9TRYP|nr:hypothetical protein AGDE_13475 [Angomonas deanei]CAD2219919.1 hypothetical protein, conserved [Angomonas deanei]|eukprot:EPY22313.1 hypothetical protein AGDE_13475 [Angomonas deanei]
MKPLALRGGKAISKRKPPNDTRVAQKNVSKVIPVSPGMSSRASTLETVNEAYERKKKWNTLENSLETGNTSRRQSATQHSYRQPFLSAIDTAAAALSDGKLNDFAQVTSFWNGERAKATLVNRMEATRQLQSTLDTLVDLKDVECLRFFVNVLDGALSESIASDRQLDINRSTSSSQYKLLSPLGTKRLRLLLNNTVEKMLALDESYISTVEKISLLDRCSRRTLFAQGTSRKGLCVPFALQTAFSQFVEGSPSYSDDLLPQINPALASGFVHPAQYKLQQTLALSKSEAKYIKDNWEVTFSSPASKEDSWEHFLNSFRSKSPLVDHAELNHLILSLKCSASPSQEERQKVRDAIRKALLNSNQNDKKLLTMLLLRDRTLRRSLNMSSGSLYSLYLLNTRSENIPRKFGGKLVKTIKALQKRGTRTAQLVLF